MYGIVEIYKNALTDPNQTVNDETVLNDALSTIDAIADAFAIIGEGDTSNFASISKNTLFHAMFNIRRNVSLVEASVGQLLQELKEKDKAIGELQGRLAGDA